MILTKTESNYTNRAELYKCCFTINRFQIVRINVTRDFCRKQRREMAKVHYNAASLYRFKISRKNFINL